jgi:hypothetical protein
MRYYWDIQKTMASTLNFLTIDALLLTGRIENLISLPDTSGLFAKGNTVRI